MLILKNIKYRNIFKNVSLTFDTIKKTSIIGKNGIGKTTLLKIIVGEITDYEGQVQKNGLNIAYFSQMAKEYTTIADVFGLEKQVIALNKIDIEYDYEALDGHLDCKEVIEKKLKFFNLNFQPLRKFTTLSGGEKVKVILSSIIDKQTNFLILDEPTNNMDNDGKKQLKDYIKNFEGGILLISHDREFLNMMDTTIELRKTTDIDGYVYGGNYDFFKEQKAKEMEALENDFNNSLKNKQAQKEQIQTTIKILAQKVKQGKKGISKKKYEPKAFGLKLSQVETSQGKLKNAEKRQLDKIETDIGDLKDKREIKQDIYFKMRSEKMANKKLLTLKNVDIYMGERVCISGRNGAGKTTLLNSICCDKMVYLRQGQEFLRDNETILQNVMELTELKEKEARNILAQFLFRTDSVEKMVCELSGGERLRVALCCILGKTDTELMLLDEPTNNLDIESIEVLESIIKEFKGAVIYVSHDEVFKKNVEIDKEIEL